MKQTKKYTVITGASAGIGLATALAFAKRGKNLILIARRKKHLENLKKDIVEIYPEVDVVLKVCDLSITIQVYQLYKDVKQYFIETWINNAGFGDYSSVSEQNMRKVEMMLQVNVTAITILSSLYVSDYQNTNGTQLINISSRGGYTIVPNAVTYCATKFYVSTFTEGLTHELRNSQAKLQAKVLAPAATKTEFGMIANGVTKYDYNKHFRKYHTSEQVADFLLQLYDSNYSVGVVNAETFDFILRDTIFEYAGNAEYNQK